MTRLALILFFSLLFFSPYAQVRPAERLYFNSLGVKDGLPEGTGTVLIQDNEKYIWIGTQNGLVRYDGYVARRYDLDAKDINSTSITTLFEDSRNDIWIGTQNGLYRYNRRGDKVEKLRLNNYLDTCACQVNYIKEDRRKNVWVRARDNKNNMDLIGLIDLTSNKATVFSNKEKGKQHLDAVRITHGVLDRQDRLWMGTERGLLNYEASIGKFTMHPYPGDTAQAMLAIHVRQDTTNPNFVWFTWGKANGDAGMFGLCRYNTVTGTYKTFRTSLSDPQSIGSDTAVFYHVDSQKRLWFITSKGLSVYDPSGEGFTNFPLPGSADVFNQLITSMKEDKAGNFWCTTSNGLMYFDSRKRVFTRFVPRGQLSEDLLSKQLFSLMLDHEGVPWFSVGNLGVQWINKNKSRFTFYENNPGYPHHFPGGQVIAFAETADGNYWIGSDRGLYYWKVRTDSFTYIPLGNVTGNNISIQDVILGREGKVWLGVQDRMNNYSGFFCYNPVTRSTTIFQNNAKDSFSLSSNNITSLVQDAAGTIWIGTSGGGLCSYDPIGGKFKLYPFLRNDNTMIPTANALDDDQVISLTLGRDNTLWIGTINGSLNKFSIQSGTFTSYMGKLPTFIRSQYEDSQDRLWAGTYFAGLYELNKVTGKVKAHTEKNGLLYDGVWGLAEDGHNNLWAASPRGLSILNLRLGNIRNISRQNGLPAEPATFNEFYRNSKGELMIGCTNGFLLINPNDFLPDTIVPVMHIENVVITKTQTDNRTRDSSLVAFGRNELRLLYNENRITFRYIGLQYSNSALTRYAYKLTGYDGDWVTAGTQRTATYTNLPPGTYTFQVKASNSDGVWTKEPASITVIISPPWWRTWRAYSIYVLLLAALIGAYTAYRSRSLRKQNRQLEVKVEKRTRELKNTNEALQQSRVHVEAQRDELAVTLEELKLTQNQLIHSEKMASLGELTAGVAHEIQNPLNFVNNFSEVNSELLDEMTLELQHNKVEEAIAISGDIKENNSRILQHGKRADSIVKSMLQHSRKTTGQKEPADINLIVDESFRLSYHGLRAKDKSFNATMVTHLQPDMPRVNLVAQDISRVMLNLFNNAFYAVSNKQKKSMEDYQPVVTVTTTPVQGAVEIRIADNGSGISQQLLDKIFQPFFTTKPTGEGTGLGLSISYDIITKAHNGTIKVSSREGDGTEFTIRLPL